MNKLTPSKLPVFYNRHIATTVHTHKISTQTHKLKRHATICSLHSTLTVGRLHDLTTLTLSEIASVCWRSSYAMRQSHTISRTSKFTQQLDFLVACGFNFCHVWSDFRIITGREIQLLKIMTHNISSGLKKLYQFYFHIGNPYTFCHIIFPLV